MANKNEIRHRIALEGDEDVKKKLDGVSEHSRRAFKEVQQTISQNGSGLDKTGDVFASIAGKTEGSHEAIKKIREALHTLHPVLDEAGLGLGRLGAFARVAGAGFGFLGTSIAGSILASLEKVTDEINDRIARIAAFAGSPEKGRQQFGALRGTADELKVPTSSLAGPFEQLLRGNQRQAPENQLSSEALQHVLSTLFKGAEADRVPIEKATEGLTALLTDLRQKGQLTPEAAKSAQEAFPTLMKRLLDSLQGSNPGALSFSTPQVFRALGRIGPQVEQDASATKAAFPGGIDDAFTKVKAASEKLTQEVTGGHAIANALEGAALFMDDIARGIKRIKKTGEENRKIQDDFNPAGLKSTPLSFQRPEFREGPASSPSVPFTAFDAENSGRLKAEAEKLGDSFKSLDPSVKGAQKTFDDFNSKGAATLDVIGSKLATQQAKIEFEHKPEETAIKLGRDKIAVDNAEIGAKAAKIGASEADKGAALAGLAPEQAEHNLRNAQTNRTSALSNFLKKRGVDTSALDQQNASQADANALEDADTALKVAQVNRKYAYLEPQKAELAQQKAQTDIRSAEFLKQDTKLTLTKDEQGQQLSSDVAGLRYAQAQLDEQKKISELGDKSVDLLGSILAALGQQKSTADVTTEDGQPVKHAAGGLIRGRGTGKSDDIPAYVSNGEFIVTADGSNLKEANRYFRRYGDGGVIDVSHLALSGLTEFGSVGERAMNATSDRSEGGVDHVGTVDLRTNHGDFKVMAHEDTLKQMKTAAVEARTFRTGKSPSWDGGH